MLLFFQLFFALLLAFVAADLKIEVMKEGLTDLKTTVLTSPNVTNFAGSARKPYIGGTAGELVLFSPEDGCTPLQESSYTRQDSTGKLRFSTVSGKSENVVVLIARGGCEINEKFLHAKAVPGVVGVLMYNGPGDEMPQTDMIVSNQHDDLPGYLISNSLGSELARKIQKYRSDPGTSSAYIEITMTPEMPSSADKANQAIQYALITIIVVLALAFGGSIVVHMRTSQFSQFDPRAGDPDAAQLPPIDVEFLQKLPLKTFKGRRNSKAKDSREAKDSNEAKDSRDAKDSNEAKDNNESSNSSNSSNSTSKRDSIDSSGKAALQTPSPTEKDGFFSMLEHDWPMNDSCPVCLDEFNNGEVINELPCGHCFHIACIHPWLQYRSPCCPLCKLDVREEYKASVRPNRKSSMQEEEKPSRISNLLSKFILKSSRSHPNESQATAASSSNDVVVTIDQPPQMSEFSSVPLRNNQ